MSVNMERAMSMKHRISLSSGYTSDDADQTLLCPICGGDYVCFGTPEIVSSDDYPKGGLGHRGSYIKIPFGCENCGEDRTSGWHLVLHFHKGNTYIGCLTPIIRDRYQEYLDSDQWKATRDMAIMRAGRVCQFCRSDKKLNVHHNTYDRLGEELPTDLLVLCQECHTTLHAVKDGRPTRMPVKP